MFINREDSAQLPCLDHLDLSSYEHIYEPSDDTFLLCDSLLKERSYLSLLKPRLCIEIGCGSGCVITYLGQLLYQIGIHAELVATDINPHALHAAKQTAIANHVSLECVRSSLLSGMEGAVGRVDVMVFNPPYVPTPDEEVAGCGIEASWAGGTDGRIVIDQFLPKIHVFLSDRGVCYLLLVKENKPNEISRILKGYGLNTEVVLQRVAQNERLLVMRISRTT